MKLIADSGSTKTDWILLGDDGSDQFQTVGLNPYFLNQQEIVERIIEGVSNNINHGRQISSVHFYGAGCGLKEKQDFVQSAISQAIPEVDSIEVASDMLGAARSLFQGEKGIACILGTGANSCVYDGSKIIDNVPSLGYVLADWGSGAVIGREFISAILLRKFSKELVQAFYDRYQFTHVQLMERIYGGRFPNRFLASFLPFLVEWKDDELCRAILEDNFEKFVEYYILSYQEEIKDMKVKCVGSVAYHFREILESVANQKGVELVYVSKSPIQDLTAFHRD
ncbi:BadF/BadG/BcrA/BcrD ATPase family protein [Sediminitomix flava]|uniref:N-acetylglucosamine kinase-like BadF-type ATPase n=1 Tax=Sediminitomix flava TaxID=379075 RepID=A0A315Z773_SEDFL|nr:BadF/BadG/BcrA/BcrD ATPase family protein [Sediminitomix flava]PWJ40802.1 N-acetylglucosamine kinase-like BadF-type ATPase [Sediminitomix flava]